MKHEQTEAIILRVSDYSESDKLITFYSPDLGKATGIAKGAKRSKKRFCNKLELFTKLHLMYNKSRQSNLLFISEADLLDSYLTLRHSYELYVFAIQFSELILRFTQESDSDPHIYQLLQWALNGLQSNKSPLQICTFFHLKLFSITGYQPEFEQCYFCNAKVQPNRRFTIHMAGGSLICEECFRRRDEKSSSAPFLSIQTLRFLKKAQGLDLKKLDRLQLPNQAAKEALLFFYRYTRFLLQQDLNSWKQVRSLLK